MSPLTFCTARVLPHLRLRFPGAFAEIFWSGNGCSYNTARGADMCLGCSRPGAVISLGTPEHVLTPYHLMRLRLYHMSCAGWHAGGHGIARGRKVSAGAFPEAEVLRVTRQGVAGPGGLPAGALQPGQAPAGRQQNASPYQAHQAWSVRGESPSLYDQRYQSSMSHNRLQAVSKTHFVSRCTKLKLSEVNSRFSVGMLFCWRFLTESCPPGYCSCIAFLAHA